MKKKKEKENKNEKEEIVVVRCTQNDVVGCRQKVEKEVEVVPWVVRSSAFFPGKFSLVSGSAWPPIAAPSSKASFKGHNRDL